MNKFKAILLFITFIAGVAVGYLINKPTEPATDDMHSMENTDTHSNLGNAADYTHNHETIEIPSHDGLPSVDLLIHKDPVSGWNAQIFTTNFTFTPEKSGTGHILGEGHAHIYVDGVKVSRVYSNWHHLEALKPGRRVIQVRLSSNNHMEFTHDGFPISASQVVEAK